MVRGGPLRNSLTSAESKTPKKVYPPVMIEYNAAELHLTSEEDIDIIPVYILPLFPSNTPMKWRIEKLIRNIRRLASETKEYELHKNIKSAMN
jgi:hypothetical protein